MNERLQCLLGLEGLHVLGASLPPEGLVVRVRSGLPAPRCGICGEVCRGYDRQPVRRWRHLTLEHTPVWLSCAPERVQCPEHGVRVQRVTWAAHRALLTTEFEQMTPWLCRHIGLAATCRMMDLPCRTAERLIRRPVVSMPDLKRIEEHYVLGADALSLRRHSEDLAAVLEQLGRPLPSALAPPPPAASAL